MMMMKLEANKENDDGPVQDGLGLPLFSFDQLQPLQYTEQPSGALTPPVQTRVASVPFMWEEAPGKPRMMMKPKQDEEEEVDEEEEDKKKKKMYCLELPPRLSSVTSTSTRRPSFSSFTPSPTTVLEGPAVGRVKKSRSLSASLSFRKTFTSKSTTTTTMGGVGGSSISGNRVGSDDDHVDHGDNESKSLAVPSPSSNLMASIFQGLKQAVVAPWRNKNRHQVAVDTEDKINISKKSIKKKMMSRSQNCLEHPAQ